MTGIERFEDLKSWQEARKLEQLVYRVTAKDAFRQDRALRWQLQDAAVAAMGNIAESHGRYSFEDKRRFLGGRPKAISTWRSIRRMSAGQSSTRRIGRPRSWPLSSPVPSRTLTCRSNEELLGRRGRGTDRGRPGPRADVRIWARAVSKDETPKWLILL